MFAKKAQIASNPANGINNIPMNNTAEPSGVNAEQIIELMQKISSLSGPQLIAMQSSVMELTSKVQDEILKQKLSGLLNSLKLNSDNTKQTINPQTGQANPMPKEIANDIIAYAQQLDKNKEVLSEYVTYNHKLAADSKNKKEEPKKKKKGSPFKVLMGMVGKLVDHGVETSLIVNKILKEVPFEEETIRNAINIVKNYNRRKNKRNKTSAKKIEDIYDVPRDYMKASATELISMLRYLTSAVDYYKDDIKQEDKSKYNNIKSQIKQIRYVLSERGLDAGEYLDEQD